MRYLTEIQMRKSVCACGITWAAPEKWFKEREEDHKKFYCPNGCKIHFPQENETEKLKRQLKQEQECCITAIEEYNKIERSLFAYKGHVTRLKGKI